MTNPALCVMGITFALVACAPHPIGTAEHPILMSEEPHHRRVFRNEFIRIVDINVPPGDTSLFHVHADPMVSVTIHDAMTWTQKPADAVGQRNPAETAPFLGTNWDQQLPMVHRVANTDTTSYRRIAAEWLRSSGIACTRPTDQPALRLLEESKFGAAYEIRLSPRGTMAEHTHSCPSLIIVGAGSLVELSDRYLDAGQWKWNAAGYTHSLHNRLDRETVVYEIDWR